MLRSVRSDPQLLNQPITLLCGSGTGTRTGEAIEIYRFTDTVRQYSQTVRQFFRAFAAAAAGKPQPGNPDKTLKSLSADHENTPHALWRKFRHIIITTKTFIRDFGSRPAPIKRIMFFRFWRFLSSTDKDSSVLSGSRYTGKGRDLTVDF